MSSWGNNDNAANAPYWAVNSTIVNHADVKAVAAEPTAANVALLYGNTSPNAYTTNQTIGLFMVNGTESGAGSDNVTAVSVSTGGARYLEAPAVTFSGGGGSTAAATASIAGGVVTSIAVTATGLGYTSAPTVVVAKAIRTIPTSAITTGTDTIAYTAHGLVAGDAVIYNNGGGASATGLTSTTTYYVIASGLTANAFKVSATSGGATVDISGTGNNAQYFEIQATGEQATAVSSLGSGAGGTQVTQPGWVLRTVGSGGRAGRVQYETLVALANPIGDGSDDLVLPDN